VREILPDKSEAFAEEAERDEHEHDHGDERVPAEEKADHIFQRARAAARHLLRVYRQHFRTGERAVHRRRRCGVARDEATDLMLLLCYGERRGLPLSLVEVM